MNRRMKSTHWMVKQESTKVEVRSKMGPTRRLMTEGEMLWYGSQLWCLKSMRCYSLILSASRYHHHHHRSFIWLIDWKWVLLCNLPSRGKGLHNRLRVCTTRMPNPFFKNFNSYIKYRLLFTYFHFLYF